MRKKKISFFVLTMLVLATVAFLTACGSPKTVPDKTVEWLIEDYMKEHFGRLELAPSYTYAVTHSPDSSTKSDTIHLDLSLTETHFIGSTTYDATYVYDKSSGLWSVSRGDEWAPVTIELYTNISMSKDIVDQALRNNGFSIDASNYEVLSAADFASFSNLDGIKATSAWANEGDNVLLLNVVLENAESARLAYNTAFDMKQLGIEIPHSVNFITKTDANYEITQIDGQDSGEYGKGYMGYIENNLFIFLASSEYDIRESFDKAMAEIGVFFE